MSKFDPRAIPGRAHYDNLMTWATSVLCRQNPEDMSELQAELTRRTKAALNSDDDDDKVAAVLAELGFCAVIDHMADIIESRGEA